MGATWIVEAAGSVDAVACEEDTYLVLSADTAFREPAEHPIRIHTALREQEPAEPGSVLVRDGTPLRLLAVVHDLSLDPTWKEEWVARALEGILREADARRLASLALPVLGAVHGRLPAARFAALLGAALERRLPRLARLELIAPAARFANLRAPLRRILAATLFPLVP